MLLWKLTSIFFLRNHLRDCRFTSAKDLIVLLREGELCFICLGTIFANFCVVIPLVRAIQDSINAMFILGILNLLLVPNLETKIILLLKNLVRLHFKYFQVSNYSRLSESRSMNVQQSGIQ